MVSALRPAIERVKFVSLSKGWSWRASKSNTLSCRYRRSLPASRYTAPSAGGPAPSAKNLDEKCDLNKPTKRQDTALYLGCALAPDTPVRLPQPTLPTPNHFPENGKPAAAEVHSSLFCRG